MKAPDKSQQNVTVNRAQLAKLMSVSLPTIDDWQRRGCPVQQSGDRGRSYRFNVADVIAWRLKDERRRQGLPAVVDGRPVSGPIHNPLRVLSRDAVLSFLHYTYSEPLVEGMVADMVKQGCDRTAASRFVLGIFFTQHIAFQAWVKTDYFDQELGLLMDDTVARGNPELQFIRGALPVNEEADVNTPAGLVPLCLELGAKSPAN